MKCAFTNCRRPARKENKISVGSASSLHYCDEHFKVIKEWLRQPTHKNWI